MDTGQGSNPRPSASSPSLRQGGHPAHARRSLPQASRPEKRVTVHYGGRAIAKEEVHSEISNFVSEIFKEELSYKVQARKFLWEFFD
jgi:hypothetical protein